MPSPKQERTCEECGEKWLTESRTAKCCSKKCAAIRRERLTPSRGGRDVTYAPELVAKVRELYGLGHTMSEVAAIAGTTVKVLQRLMPKHGIARRAAIPRDQTGEKNAVWRGEEAGHQAMHLRVWRARGMPSHCGTCDATAPEVKYEWANMTGHYEDINDYVRLCVPCHRKLDARRRKLLGRPTSWQRGGKFHV
jgi:hypothetical protein